MIGERTRLAREACRLTQQELATISGIPLGTISSVEAGRVAVPSASTIEQVAIATGFPSEFFYLGPLPDIPDGYFRKLKRGEAKDSKQLRAQIRQLVELVQNSERQLRLPPVAIKPIENEARRKLPSSEIESIAQEVRHLLKVGAKDPIPNFTRAIERAGIVVVRLPIVMLEHDSYSVWPDYGLGGRPLIAITSEHPGDRDRANVGHELGHLVLHVLRTGIEVGDAEKEAWRFAGAILLPQEVAEEAMRPPVTLRVLMNIKANFGTSIAFNAQRARDLGLVTQDQFVSLRKQISARGWTKVEPVEVENEKPVLIPKIIDQMAGTGSSTERAKRIFMPVFTVRALSA